MYSVFIDGAEGTTGLRIHQRLAADSGVSVIALSGDERKSLPRRLQAIESADVSILCLPDAAAAEIAAMAPAGARICDASTAHRTKPGWEYGFPELSGRRQRIAGCSRLAVPGCHATGFLALAAPLAEKGLLSPAAQLYCHSLTGFSGGGKKMIAQYADPARPKDYDAPRLYGLELCHKHLPEMTAIAGLTHAPLFCPVVSDYYSGMLVSLPLPSELLPEKWRCPERLADFYREYYNGQRLIGVNTARPPDGTLSGAFMAGLDSMELCVLGNRRQLLLTACFDNLGKGASGAALQCLNLMLGRCETTGLCT